MTDAQRFYTSGGTLGSTAQSYVTRRADQDLLRHLRNGDFCYVLTSRQMGKSSLMVRAAGTLRSEGVSVAILDLTRIGQYVTIEQWYDGLLVRLGSDLNLEDELDDYWTADRQTRLSPMQRFMGALREVVLPAIKGNLSIFIDEIDAVRSLHFSGDEFFAGIRECYNRRVVDPEFKRLTFCLIGVAQPSDLITDVQITPFNIGHRIELTDFSEIEARPLLEGMKDKSTRPKGAEAILHRVLYWTGGHPYLTQRLCEAVGELDKDVTPQDVDNVCADLFLSSRSREQQDNLIFVRDRVLASAEHRAVILDLYAKVLRGEKVRDDDSNALIDALRLSGLLIVCNGYLKVRNRIYATVFDRHWIMVNMPDAEVRRQKAAYRRGILFAMGISLPILAVIVCLGFFDLQIEHSATRESYFADAASAQEAFNTGDYSTGNDIIGGWDPVKINSELAGKSWLSKLDAWWKDFLQGRAALENSFAIRLLRGEASGGGRRLHRQDAFLHNHAGVDKTITGCGAEMALATTTFRGQPLIAAAGADSSVQIWNSSTLAPFAHMQLRYSPDHKSIQHDLPVTNLLEPCSDFADGADLPGIMSLSFSPDGSKLAISTGSWSNATSPGFVVVWDMNQLDTVKPQVSFEKTADSVQFSSDGQYLAAGSEDGSVQIWKFSGDGPSHFETIDPGHYGFRSNGGRVGGSGAHVVALSTAAKHLLAIGYGDGHLLIYDYLHPDSAKPRYAGVAHVSGIMSMIFLDQKDRDLRLVVGSRDGELVMLAPQELIDEYKKGREYRKGHGKLDAQAALKAVKLTLNPGQGVLLGLAAGYNDDHSKAWLLTSGSIGTVGLWALTPNFSLMTTYKGHSGGVQSAVFCKAPPDSPKATSAAEDDPGCIFSASADKTVRMWKYPSNEEDAHVMGDGLLFPGQMVGVAFLNNKTLVTAVGATTENNHDHSEIIATWEFDAKLVREPPHEKQGKPILGFGVSPDDNFLVYTTRDRDLVFVDLESDGSVGSDRQPVPVNVTLNPKIEVRCLNPAGNEIETCSSNQRDYLVMGVADRADIGDDTYGTGKGLCMWHITRDTGAGSTPRFSIAAGNLNPCETDTADMGTFPKSWPRQMSEFWNLARRVGMFDVAGSGKTIATSSDAKNGSGVTKVEIWNSGDLLRGLSPRQSTDEGSMNRGFLAQFADLRFSPDGKFLAATTINAKMYYWPVDKTSKMPMDDAAPPVTLSARGQVLAFSPNDSILAIGQQDSRILLWSTEFRHTVMTIRTHTGGVLGLQFSPDCLTLASSGNDGQVEVMRAQP